METILFDVLLLKIAILIQIINLFKTIHYEKS